MDKENKVQFNLKNVHYAILDESSGKPAFSTPVAVPGAVNLNLSQQGEISPFYADGLVYYQSVNNNGYSGDLEMARFLDQMLQEVWGFVLESTDKVLVENAANEVKAFALLFQIDGDVDNDLYCLYKCTGTRPAITGATNTDTKTPQTQKSTISAVPLPDGDVMARTTSTTPAEVRANWFKSVYRRSDAAATS